MSRPLKILRTLAAADKLFNANIGLAKNFSFRYAGNNLSHRQDIDQICKMALWKACLTWDPKKGGNIGTHATWQMKSGISEFFIRYGIYTWQGIDHTRGAPHNPKPVPTHISLSRFLYPED